MPGGTATYSGRAAHALGCRTAVLTSTGTDIDLGKVLPGITTHCVPAEQSTTFENIYTTAGRTQIVHGVATLLRPEHVPKDWQRASVVHLGPIVNEIDPDMIGLFSNSQVGLTPQGWFRKQDENGRVLPRSWPAAPKIMPLATAVILSMEDLADPNMLEQIRSWARLLVLTERDGGCTVFFREEVRQVPAPPVIEANPTGAGDIFATAFFVRLYQTKGNAWEAAEFANRIASTSVTQDDLESKVEVIEQTSREYLAGSGW